MSIPEKDVERIVDATDERFSFPWHDRADSKLAKAQIEYAIRRTARLKLAVGEDEVVVKREALREIQYYYNQETDTCVCCYSPEGRPHMPACWLAAALEGDSHEG